MRGTRAAAALGVLAFVAGACGGDDDGGGETDIGSGLGQLSEETTTTRGEVQVITTTTTTEAAPVPTPNLDPPVIPAESTTPTTAPGQEPIGWPIGFGSGEEIPLFGDIVVDLEPGGYLDFPAHLEQGRQVAVVSGGDDGILTHIEIWLPDGTLQGSWDGGEPGVINGWEWVSDDDRVPQTGTYVFRVIHTGGSDEPFLLRFYGAP